MTTHHHTIGEVSAGLQRSTCQPASHNVVQFDSGVGRCAVARAGHGAVLGCTLAWRQVHCCAVQVSQAVFSVTAVHPSLITLHVILHAVCLLQYGLKMPAYLTDCDLLAMLSQRSTP